MNLPAKAFKYYEYAVTKLSQACKERSYALGSSKVRYILEEYEQSKDLIVVFSACTRVGIKARYNYMRTLADVRCSKLFILDDGGPDHRGSYYLGRYPSFEFRDAVESLIASVCEECGVERALYVGTSKGAWSALLFGMRCPLFDEPPELIVGAPQYWLGRYLDNQFPGSEVPGTTLTGICGSHSRAAVIASLDQMLQEAIANSSRVSSQRILLHYSASDHTYQEHIVELKRDLECAGAKLTCDVAEYVDHGEVSSYFPPLLRDELSRRELL